MQKPIYSAACIPQKTTPAALKACHAHSLIIPVCVFGPLGRLLFQKYKLILILGYPANLLALH